MGKPGRKNLGSETEIKKETADLPRRNASRSVPFCMYLEVQNACFGHAIEIGSDRIGAARAFYGSHY
jgi:hypothetical protein